MCPFQWVNFNAINFCLVIVSFYIALIPGWGSIAHSFKVKRWMSVNDPRLLLKSVYSFYLLFQLCCLYKWCTQEDYTRHSQQSHGQAQEARRRCLPMFDFLFSPHLQSLRCHPSSSFLLYKFVSIWSEYLVSLEFSSPSLVGFHLLFIKAWKHFFIATIIILNCLLMVVATIAIATTCG